ncbi:MAG TPA: hypothetical protein VGD40_25370 [Chryseosolibacter sp.]
MIRKTLRENIAIIIAVIFIICYSVALNTTKDRVLTWYAYGGKDVAVNEKFRTSSYFLRPEFQTDTTYKFTSPRDKFANQSIADQTQLRASMLSSQASSFIIDSVAIIPVKIASQLAQIFQPGDQIALSVNGMIVPEGAPETRTLTLVDIRGSADAGSKIFVVLVHREHLSDSLWLSKADDHITPLLVGRPKKPTCPKGEVSIWKLHPSLLDGGHYACQPLGRKKVIRSKDCDCEKRQVK